VRGQPCSRQSPREFMSWRRRLRIGLVPFIGEGRPTCSSSSPTRCAASPSSSASRGKTWCCSRVWCRTIWRGRVQTHRPETSESLLHLSGSFGPYTTRECEKVFGPLLSRLLCDVTAYSVAGNVRRHRIAVSAVPSYSTVRYTESESTVGSYYALSLC
jgi:hypothetical protein